MEEITLYRLLFIRNHEKVNLLNLNAVLEISYNRRYVEIIDMIETKPDRYIRFILSGNDDASNSYHLSFPDVYDEPYIPVSLFLHEGTRLELISAFEAYTLKPGFTGTVILIDSSGNILVEWDDGQTEKLIPGIDLFRII